MRLLPHTQLQLPAVNPVVDNASLSQIHDAEQFLIKNYRKVLSALIAKAQEGSIGAADVIRKIVADFKSEQQEIRVAERPAGPLPIAVRIAQAQISFAIEPKKGKPSVRLTSAEFSELPQDKQADLQQHYAIEIVEPAMLIPPSATPAQAATELTDPVGTVAAPSSQKPNHTCSVCGQGFYSNQPAALRCADCRKQRDLEKLAKHRQKHGKHLTPAMRAILEPEKSDGVLPL
jgi:hypothetical protein